MKKIICKFLSGRLKEQAGQALVLVLVFFLLGSLTLAPVLMHMATALKTGTKYEFKTNELFTADAGIESGLWRIKDDFLGPSYDPYDFTTVWPYYTDPLNDLSATVQVQNVWLPTNPDLEELEEMAAFGLNKNVLRAIAESKKLEITGTAGGDSSLPFYVKIDFRPDVGDNLTIKSVGVWLPQGFEYSGDCSLTPAPDSEDYGPAPGGSAVVWEYDGPFYPLFTDFNPVSENETLSVTFNFRYEPPPDNPSLTPITAIAWVSCEMLDAYGNVALNPYAAENVPIAWDQTTRYYKIKSTAGATKIETYSSKSQMTNLGNGIPGDYVATGNSLMTDTNHDNRRDKLYTSTDATVTTIPANGDVVYAYLYWSGYRQGTEDHKLNDGCANFDNWGRNGEEGDRIRVPTADGDTDGTWDTAPYWDDVDETSYNDDDYITGTTDSGGYQLFEFTPFTVPDQEILGLTVYVRARDISYDRWGNDIRPAIKVNGEIYEEPTGHNPGSSFSDYYYTWNTNPHTGAAWTVADINGTGDNPLQAFGVYSDDLNPDVQVSMVYAEVNLSLWSVYNNKFQGQGSASATAEQRTLTLKNSIDLSSCIPGCVAVTWDQSKNYYLETDDALYFAFSGDGGAHWSDNIVSGNGTAMDSPYFYVIPNEYVTSNFKMRFYADLDDAAETVTIDNIKVSYLPPDNSVLFKINDVQYSLSEISGNETPVLGGEITASTAQAFPSLFGSGFIGYSYACYRDVSEIVKKYPEDGKEHHTGNYKYTVGNVDAYTGHDLSYAGWSLIIIYGSPSSAGHYLYITDAFSFNPGTTTTEGVNLDFDRDGIPGGDIKGFVIPKPITDKYGEIIFPVAARLTCFVGEGDAWRTGDYIQITGQQSGITRRLADNPWDGVSTQPGTLDGIDIDTFEVLWSDGVLTANDKSLHVDMWAGGYSGDAYNLIYFILSVQNETTTSGTGHYVISGS